jgi:uncharacterized protein with ParB-like and HNH nuclease domain
VRRVKISEILEHLNRKELVLPPFQREFVWNDKEKIEEFVEFFMAIHLFSRERNLFYILILKMKNFVL